MEYLKNFVEFNESIDQNSIDLKISSEFNKIQDYLNSKKQSYESDGKLSIFNSKSSKSQILADLIDNDFDLTKEPSVKNENTSFEKPESGVVITPPMIDKIIEETNLKKSLIKEYSVKIWNAGCELLKQFFTYPLHLLKKYLYKMSLDCGYKFEISNLVSLKATISFLLISICYAISVLYGLPKIDLTDIGFWILIARLAGSLFAFSKKLIQTTEEHSKFYSINDFFDDISDKYKSIVKKSIPSDYAIDIEKWMNTLESKSKEKVSKYLKILKNVIVKENLQNNLVIRKVSELIGKIKEFVKSDYYDWASTDAKGIVEILENILSELFKSKKYQDYPSFGSE